MTATPETSNISPAITLGPLTHREVEQLGRLVNAFGYVGHQIIALTSPAKYRQARDLLRKVKRQDEPLLTRLDELAQSIKDESPLRLIDDIQSTGTDVMQNLKLARRCLSVCGFLGHCIVVYSRVEATLTVPEGTRSLH
jgi:hypothetical protein